MENQFRVAANALVEENGSRRNLRSSVGKNLYSAKNPKPLRDLHRYIRAKRSPHTEMDLGGPEPLEKKELALI